MKHGFILVLLGCLAAGAQAATNVTPAAAGSTSVVAAAGGDLNATAASNLMSIIAAGQKCLLRSDWVGAVQLFHKAQQLAPNHPLVRFGLAAACIGTRQFDEAYRLLTSLQTEFPDSAEVMNNMAWVRLKSRDPAVRDLDQALRLSQRALFLMSSDPSTWDTLAEVHYAAGRYAQAQRAARIALGVAAAVDDPNQGQFRELVRRCEQAAAGAQP